MLIRFLTNKSILALFFVLLLAFGLRYCIAPAEAGSAKPRAATERTMRFLEDFAYGPALQFALRNTPLVLPETYELPTLTVGSTRDQTYRGQFWVRNFYVGRRDWEYDLIVHGRWNVQSVGDRATVAHEMTHWLQYVSGNAIGRMYCDMEQEAYTVGWAYYLMAKKQVMGKMISAHQVGTMICTDQSPRYWGRPVRL